MERDPGGKREDGGGRERPRLLVALPAGALLVKQFPVSHSRPATPEPKAYESVTLAGADARLWQDPIGAVAQGLKGRCGMQSAWKRCSWRAFSELRRRPVVRDRMDLMGMPTSTEIIATNLRRLMTRISDVDFLSCSSTSQ